MWLNAGCKQISIPEMSGFSVVGWFMLRENSWCLCSDKQPDRRDGSGPVIVSGRQQRSVAIQAWFLGSDCILQRSTVCQGTFLECRFTTHHLKTLCKNEKDNSIMHSVYPKPNNALTITLETLVQAAIEKFIPKWMCRKDCNAESPVWVEF